MSGCVTPDKGTLRRQFSAWRKQQLPDRTAALSDMLCRRVASLPAFRETEWLLGFAPMLGEPDIRPLLQTALAEGRRVAMPRCVPGTRELRFYAIAAWDELTPGSYGIAEPPALAGKLWQPTADALCLVPALCFDRRGYRLGYGGGYYDRFLPAFPGLTVGLCPQACLLPELPHDRYDHPVSVVVTETEVCDRRK